MFKLNKSIALALGAVSMVGTAQASDIQLKLKQQQNLPKIIGGVITPDGERPWMASLQWDGQHFCGGSVIEQRWILTAAHCVEDVAEQDLASIRVQVNVNDLSNNGEGEFHSVARVYNHPGYAQGESTDIALLYLESEVSSSVPTIALADANMMAEGAEPGTVATVSGWGNTSINGENFPDLMHKVEVPLVSNQVCNSAEAYNGSVKDTELCAGFSEGGKDSCQGDSGGPLTVFYNGQENQVGVVSWGEGCALPNKYGVYARVSALKSWVDSTMFGNSDVPPTDPDLPGDDPVPPGDPDSPVDGKLVNGMAIQGLSGDWDSEIYFIIEVPDNAKILWVDIRGDNGDADVYIKHNAEPSLGDYDYAPFLDGSNEHKLIRNPAAGTWHIMVHGYDAYDDLELMGFAR
ncbi:DUF1986 domain-containing protein [Planctobacterium marinum]|uniref:Peptidase S1 domain-containing protein n=1 Tax=Planctobacterium marinum TaxID=1631968 RepID=A0AA48I2T5_9ALTE|nr:hypothetical protein MACH26_04110 [Planctobacterium marinum]